MNLRIRVCYSTRSVCCSMIQLLEWKRLYTAGSSVKADLIIFRTLLFAKTFGWEDLAARVLLVTSTFICAQNPNWNNFDEMGDDNEGVDPQHDFVARAYLPNYLSHRYVTFIHLGKQTNSARKKLTSPIVDFEPHHCACLEKSLDGILPRGERSSGIS
jgi:hypothetical protein